MLEQASAPEITFADLGDGSVRLAGVVRDSPAKVGKIVGWAPAHLRPDATTYVTDERMFGSRSAAEFAVIVVRPDSAVVLKQADPDRPDLPMSTFFYRVSEASDDGR